MEEEEEEEKKEEEEEEEWEEEEKEGRHYQLLALRITRKQFIQHDFICYNTGNLT